MGFNKDKRKKLGELLAKRRAVTAGVGTSTPRSPPNSVTSAPKTTEPAPVDWQKGVVAVVFDSEDKDTCTGLVFKRPRVGEAAAPSHSAFGGLTPAFRDNPLSASSPRDLVVHEGGGRPPLKAAQYLLLPSALCSSNKPSSASKTIRCWRA